MNIQKLREVLKPFQSQNVITAYPAALDDDDQIIVSTDVPPQQILKVGIWKGKVVLFYEEKPMFVAICLSNQSLAETTICDTMGEAIVAAIRYVEEYSTSVELGARARQFLLEKNMFLFTEAECDYAIHVGAAS